MAATLKCDTIQNASSSTANITLDTAGNATVGNTLAMGSSFLRNRIINGDFKVAQRGTSFSGNDIYTLDRWNLVSSGAATLAQSTDTPNSSYAASATVTGTGGSVYAQVRQRIESVNCVGLSGNAATLSFWVKNVSGSNDLFYTVYYANAADNFSAVTDIVPVTTVTSSLSSSWTRYTFTISSMPSGSANGVGVAIGSTTANASFRITGVQLEVGSVATPFERRQYGQELALCQRYLPAFSYASGANPYIAAGMVTSLSSSTTAWFTVALPVTTRVPPTGVTVSAASHFAAFLPSTATTNATGFTFGGATTTSANFNISGLSGTTAGYSTLLFMNTSSAYMYFTGCEL